MKQLINHAIKSTLKQLGVGITGYNALKQMRQNESAGADIEFLLTLPRSHAPQLLTYLRQSKSQIRQDLFVLSELQFKRGGFFVDFGATNGVDLSNTYLLEKEFGWKGILAEPAKRWHNELILNRSAIIETGCVWGTSGSVLSFNEVIGSAELSTVDSLSSVDLHRKARKSGIKYDVKTISLNDLLEKHNAPNVIDYLSIDTEGSELEILRNFNFAKHQFSVITCEHNYSPMREELYELLTRNGYLRKYQPLSKFDDWYVSVRLERS